MCEWVCGMVCLYGCVCIQRIVIGLCVHSYVGVLVTDPVMLIGHRECVEYVALAFGVGGGHVLSVLVVMAGHLW